jgi:CRISPR-associated endonuclease/helicase Cas3
MMNQINAWGKLNQQGQSHPLTAHMLDVAACFCAIARGVSVRRALTRAAGRSLTEIDLVRLAVLAFLHDVGKANAGFQAKWWGHAEQALPKGWPAPLAIAVGICVRPKKRLCTLHREKTGELFTGCMGLGEIFCSPCRIDGVGSV